MSQIQVAKAKQDRVKLERGSRENDARLQQKALAAEQAKLEERRWMSICCAILPSFPTPACFTCLR